MSLLKLIINSFKEKKFTCIFFLALFPLYLLEVIHLINPNNSYSMTIHDNIFIDFIILLFLIFIITYILSGLTILILRLKVHNQELEKFIILKYIFITSIIIHYYFCFRFFDSQNSPYNYIIKW